MVETVYAVLTPAQQLTFADLNFETPQQGLPAPEAKSASPLHTCIAMQCSTSGPAKLQHQGLYLQRVASIPLS